MRPETTGRVTHFRAQRTGCNLKRTFCNLADERPEEGRVLRQIATRLSSRDESSSSIRHHDSTGRVTHFRAQRSTFVPHPWDVGPVGSKRWSRTHTHTHTHTCVSPSDLLRASVCHTQHLTASILANASPKEKKRIVNPPSYLHLADPPLGESLTILPLGLVDEVRTR